MRIKLHVDIKPDLNDGSKKDHDLLLDGPVNKNKK
jgi:hypothetical protein